MSRKESPGLSSTTKQKLIDGMTKLRLRRLAQVSSSDTSDGGVIPERFYRFAYHPDYQKMRLIREEASRRQIDNPFFKVHEQVAGATTWIGGREYLNYASYNYLGLCGHPKVNAAAKAAIDRYGTSASASRPVAGERPVHRKLEQALACAYGTEDALTFVSGHATNVTVIGYLFGPRDLVVHDELIHNSVLMGCQLGGVRRLSFPHNDWRALDRLLREQRRRFERVLIVVEGLYSMDGDWPDLPRFIDIKQRHRTFLMVDEAHSFGVMGEHGLGIREYFGLSGSDVDIWMGTLSKALAACGGYIAGETDLVEHLRYLAPGFLYSVGLSPPLAAASHAALQILAEEPERVSRLHDAGRLFLKLAREAGLDTGTSGGLAVIPVITGSSVKAARLSARLFQRGINVQPIIYPAVPEQAARLRFFLSSEHTEAQIRETVTAVVEEMGRL